MVPERFRIGVEDAPFHPHENANGVLMILTVVVSVDDVRGAKKFSPGDRS
jgi:hypothetical protein